MRAKSSWSIRLMKGNESDASHRIAVTQNGHVDALVPADVPLRAGDAIHTATALKTGETEIWTDYRHLSGAVVLSPLAGPVLDRFAIIRYSPGRPTPPPYVYRPRA